MALNFEPVVSNKFFSVILVADKIQHHLPSCGVNGHPNGNLPMNTGTKFQTKCIADALKQICNNIKDDFEVWRNQLQSTEFLSTFAFGRQNIGAWCKQTFCFWFSSKQILIFSLFSLDGHKISIFFKIAVWQSDSMKWNYGGFTLKTKNYYQKDAGEFYWVFISRIYTL